MVKSILAGIFIGLGGALNLVLTSNNQPYLGAIFFSLGLLLVCFLNAYLFTGKVGYILETPKKLDILKGALGNTIGAFIIGLIFSFVFPFNTSFDFTSFINNKIIDLFHFDYVYFFKFLFRSMLAGVFVFLAVEGFKKVDNKLISALLIILAISGMIITKSEHSIANLFYYGALINYVSIDFLSVFTTILLTMLGNSAGAILMYLL